ncbi:uncharacterized protein LOC143433403 [Xylocopa sonorina]|uniref:uncharacterized protein LOC143433403 n=1 Tax=Xylocopa sonorina TaxID=1818115 RepID=UPI00403B36F1
MPKLRKNRRIETRWGVKYYTAVKNAVFLTQAQPYVPTAPPPSMRNYIPECETRYMCTQCKDCFHFRSSLEDHIARKSWILGYWCQHCFVTTCGHNSTEGSLCSICMQSDREKRSYLQRRGLRKGQKFGVVRIFYNQCHFFAHLKTHNVNLVYMGDLMLMPLPTNMNDWRPEVDVTCEALMEHTFITKVHIMDWLKEKNIADNWWKLTVNKTEDSSSPVALILKHYKGRFYFKPLEVPIDELFSTLNFSDSTLRNGNTSSGIEVRNSIDKVGKKTSPPSTDTIASISDESVIENDDNPCTANEIAFVDCGLTSKYLEPEIPLNSIRKKDSTVSGRSVQNTINTFQSSNVVVSKLKKNRARINCISPDMVMSYGNIIITPKRDMKDALSNCPDKQQWKSLIHKSNKGATPIKVVTEGDIAKVDSYKKLNKSLLSSSLMKDPLSKAQSEATNATKMNACKNKLDKSKQNVHTLTVNSSQKFVTIQSAKHVDINTIINKLPPRITTITSNANNKKIVFIRQASDNVTVSGNKESSSKTVVNLVSDKNEKLLEVKKNLKNEKLSQTNKESNKTVSKIETERAKDKGRSFPGKVVYQNGRKYIIKKSTGPIKNLKSVSNVLIPVKDSQRVAQSKSTNGVPPLIPLNSTEIENISSKERINSSFHEDVTPLTPSPSPSELSSSSSCDVQSKHFVSSMKGSQRIDTSYLAVEHTETGINVRNTNNSFESLSFHKGEDQSLYLDIKFHNQKPIYTIVDTSTMVTKCREEMLNEFFHLSYFELKKRYDHLQQITEEISRVMNFVTDIVIKENLKAVLILQTVLKHCIDKCSEKSEDTDEIDVPLNEWELEYHRTSDKPVCKGCNKMTKPKYYIPGFSKPARNDNYCSCYRHVCHKCYTYQGNSTRFVAHQTFHDKEKPYLCPDCYRKFTTYKSLEVHTWTTCFHTLKKRVLGCKVCEVDGFQDMESVARHFAIMHSHNKIACDKCYIILPSYSQYRKHHKEKHSETSDDHQPIRLVLCKLGRCIVRCEDYMLHMEKHSVVQRLIWFKCPFCVFIHVEAKRIMSHLQSGHETRLKELISPEVLSYIKQVEIAAVKSAKSNLQQSKFTNAQKRSVEDGTVIPKIINARTITSEVFERGAHDYLINYDMPQSSDDVNVQTALLVKPSKISPKILDVRSVADPKVDPDRPKYSAHGTAGKLIKIEKEEAEEYETPKGMGKSEKIESAEITATIKIEPKDPVDNGWGDSEGKKTSSDPLSVEYKQEQSRSDSSMNEIKTEITKPPPLTRIPRHVLEPNRGKKTGHTTKGGKTRRDLPQRIAINGPANSSEVLTFSCHLCGELINTSKSILIDHFRSKHPQECTLSTVTADLLRISSEFINGGYKEVLSSKKRKSENTVSGSKRRRRWTPKKYTDGKSANFAGLGLCVKQETAKDSEGNFRCKKCDQRCSDMTNLREHIASNHRIRGRYLICLECGDNFVVAPSLQMHLKAFHGIEDPITYMAQNTSYAPDNVDNLEAGGKSIEANQCHVCMAVFEDKAAVDKHLRVHGMAFLNRKRIEAQNALKSPERKAEEEEEKHMPIKTNPKGLIRKDKPAETILEKITATI